MLTIYINKNADGVVDYFTRSLTKDDYFFTGKSIYGCWHGKLVKELGLPEQVTKKDFSSLAHNRHPVTGKKLTVRNVSKRRTSIEYTFSAPKSISLVMAINKDKEILNAHRRAVQKAMKAIETDMQTQVTVKGKKHYENSGNIVYARFDHFTSRPVREDLGDTVRYASDPNLHSHAIVMNVTRHGGRYQAIEGSTIHRVAGYYAAIYHSELSKSLQELGYPIVRTKNRYEIKNISRSVIEKFSKRTIEIEKLAKDLGILNPKKKAQLGAKTRLNKSKVTDNEDLQKIWHSRLSACELHAIQNARSGHSDKGDQDVSGSQALELSLSHHLERKSAAPTKKILAYAMTQGYGHLSREMVEDALVSRDDILYAQKKRLEFLTTKALVAEENSMIEFATSGKNILPPIHIDYTPKRDFLNDQQKKAIHQILTSYDRVTILSGKAGVGKSTLVQEIHQAHQEMGKTLLAFAPSSGASRGVLREKGIKDADTIAMFLFNKELQEKAKGQTILIDEAGMVGVTTMNKIFAIAEEQKARIILSGDSRQNSSPEHGDALRWLEDKAQLMRASVGKILRQRSNPEYKRAVELLSQGNLSEGFTKLDEMGAILEIPDTKERHEALATAYLNSIEHRKTTLVVAPTHTEGNAITKAIRHKMRMRGRIHNTEVSITIQKNVSYTQAQKQDMTNYENGMIVQFHQNAKGGFCAGKKYTVIKNEKQNTITLKDENNTEYPLPIEDHERFQVFQTSEIKLSKGDDIRITKNGKSLEKSKLHNGQIYRVEGFTKDGDLQLSNGKTLSKDFGNFTHGYVQTSHSAQGKDAHTVLIAQSSLSLGAGNEKQFYVSASRAKERIKIFTDSKADLREAISRSGERVSAKEIAKDYEAWILRNSMLEEYYRLNNLQAEYGYTKEYSQERLQEPQLEKE